MGILASLFGANKARDEEHTTAIAELRAKVAELEARPVGSVDAEARAAAAAVAESVMGVTSRIEVIEAEFAALEGDGSITLPSIQP